MAINSKEALGRKIGEINPDILLSSLAAHSRYFCVVGRREGGVVFLGEWRSKEFPERDSLKDLAVRTLELVPKDKGNAACLAKIFVSGYPYAVLSHSKKPIIGRVIPHIPPGTDGMEGKIEKVFGNGHKPVAVLDCRDNPLLHGCAITVGPTKEALEAMVEFAENVRRAAFK